MNVMIASVRYASSQRHEMQQPDMPSGILSNKSISKLSRNKHFGRVARGRKAKPCNGGNDPAIELRRKRIDYSRTFRSSKKESLSIGADEVLTGMADDCDRILANGVPHKLLEKTSEMFLSTITTENGNEDELSKIVPVNEMPMELHGVNHADSGVEYEMKTSERLRFHLNVGSYPPILGLFAHKQNTGIECYSKICNLKLRTPQPSFPYGKSHYSRKSCETMVRHEDLTFNSSKPIQATDRREIKKIQISQASKYSRRHVPKTNLKRICGSKQMCFEKTRQNRNEFARWTVRYFYFCSEYGLMKHSLKQRIHSRPRINCCSNFTVRNQSMSSNLLRDTDRCCSNGREVKDWKNVCHKTAIPDQKFYRYTSDIGLDTESNMMYKKLTWKFRTGAAKGRRRILRTRTLLSTELVANSAKRLIFLVPTRSRLRKSINCCYKITKKAGITVLDEDNTSRCSRNQLPCFVTTKKPSGIKTPVSSFRTGFQEQTNSQTVQSNRIPFNNNLPSSSQINVPQKMSEKSIVLPIASNFLHTLLQPPTSFTSNCSLEIRCLPLYSTDVSLSSFLLLFANVGSLASICLYRKTSLNVALSGKESCLLRLMICASVAANWAIQPSAEVKTMPLERFTSAQDCQDTKEKTIKKRSLGMTDTRERQTKRTAPATDEAFLTYQDKSTQSSLTTAVQSMDSHFGVKALVRGDVFSTHSRKQFRLSPASSCLRPFEQRTKEELVIIPNEELLASFHLSLTPHIVAQTLSLQLCSKNLGKMVGAGSFHNVATFKNESSAVTTREFVPTSTIVGPSSMPLEILRPSLCWMPAKRTSAGASALSIQCADCNFLGLPSDNFLELSNSSTTAIPYQRDTIFPSNSSQDSVVHGVTLNSLPLISEKISWTDQYVPLTSSSMNEVSPQIISKRTKTISRLSNAKVSGEKLIANCKPVEDVSSPNSSHTAALNCVPRTLNWRNPNSSSSNNGKSHSFKTYCDTSSLDEEKQSNFFPCKCGYEQQPDGNASCLAGSNFIKMRMEEKKRRKNCKMEKLINYSSCSTSVSKIPQSDDHLITSKSRHKIDHKSATISSKKNLTFSRYSFQNQESSSEISGRTSSITRPPTKFQLQDHYQMRVLRSLESSSALYKQREESSGESRKPATSLKGQCWRIFFALMIVLSLSTPGFACPSACVCKWKGGKETVECVNKGLTSLPAGLNPETQVLDFTGNALVILSREKFKILGLINLQRIYVSRCKLVQLDDAAFRGLSNLVELDLSNNELNMVPAAALEHTAALMRLLLSHNPITQIRDGAFSKLHFLTSLEMTGCALKVLESRAFQGLDKLEWLKLDDNQLTSVPETMLLPKMLHGVDLHNNPWHCDCKLQHLRSWLVKYNVPSSIEPKCSTPQRLEFQVIKHVLPEDFACPPEIRPTSLFLDVLEGKNVSFACHVVAEPSADIDWRFNGYPLQNSSFIYDDATSFYIYEDREIKEETVSYLRIEMVTVAHGGIFQCAAENTAGKMISNFTLRVSVPPTVPVKKDFIEDNFKYIGLALASLVLLVIILCCILLSKCCRRKSCNRLQNNINASASSKTEKEKVQSAAPISSMPKYIQMGTPTPKTNGISDSGAPISVIEASPYRSTPPGAPHPNPDIISDSSVEERIKPKKKVSIMGVEEVDPNGVVTTRKLNDIVEEYEDNFCVPFDQSVQNGSDYDPSQEGMNPYSNISCRIIANTNPYPLIDLPSTDLRRTNLALQNRCFEAGPCRSDAYSMPKDDAWLELNSNRSVEVNNGKGNHSAPAYATLRRTAKTGGISRSHLLHDSKCNSEEYPMHVSPSPYQNGSGRFTPSYGVIVEKYHSDGTTPTTASTSLTGCECCSDQKTCDTSESSGRMSGDGCSFDNLLGPCAGGGSSTNCCFNESNGRIFDNTLPENYASLTTNTDITTDPVFFGSPGPLPPEGWRDSDCTGSEFVKDNNTSPWDSMPLSPSTRILYSPEEGFSNVLSTPTGTDANSCIPQKTIKGNHDVLPPATQV